MVFALAISQKHDVSVRGNHIENRIHDPIEFYMKEENLEFEFVPVKMIVYC